MKNSKWRNKNKGYLRIVICIALILLTIPNIVQAAQVDAGSLDGSVGSKCGNGACWPYIGGKVVKAMRVTLMHTDGTPYSGAHTLNVVNQDTYDYLKNTYGYYYWTGNANKVQYLKGNVSLGAPTKKPNEGADPQYLRVDSTIDPYFSSLGIAFSSHLSSWTIDAIWNPLEGNQYTVDSLKDIMFEMFGIDVNDIPAGTEDDLWIVAEPLTIVKYNYSYYFGTSYELASLGYDGISKSMINSVIGKALPCAAYVKGSILQNYSGVPGVDLNSKTYFNGSLKAIEYDSLAYKEVSINGNKTLQSVCTSGSDKPLSNGNLLSKEAVTGTYGVGISILHFPTIDRPTCEMVEKSNLTATWQLKGMTLEQLNGLPDELYYESNGRGKTVSKDWYIKECTCYGVYEEYQNKRGQDITSLPKSSIREIFNSNFFNDFYNNYNNLYKDATNTMWDYAKYERLECGYNNSVNSCENIKFDNVSIIDSIKLQNSGNCINYLDTNRNHRRPCGGHGMNTWCEYSDRSIYEELLRDFKSDYAIYESNLTSYLFNSLNGSWGFKACFSRNLEETKNQLELVGASGDCNALPLWGSSAYTAEYVNEHRSQYNACFNAYNSKHGTTWNLSSYQTAGCSPNTPDETDNRYDCTPQYGIGTCIDGETIVYQDRASNLTKDDYWNHCVFSDDEAYYSIDIHKNADKNANLTYFDDSISNSYCEVYCTEDLVASFDSSMIQVKAGQHFTWNNHVVAGSRTCKTKEIKYDQFVSDLENANESIKNNYIDWQLEILKNNSINNGSVSASNHTTPAGWCGSDGEGNDLGHSCSCGGCSPYTLCSYTPQTSSVSFMGQNRTVNSWSYTTGGHNATCNSISSYADYNSENSKKTNYDNSLIYARGLVEQMQACYNEGSQANWTNNVYHVDPKATIYYEEATGQYNYTDQPMNANTSYTDLEQNLNCVSDIRDLITACSGTSCTITKQNMKKCTSVEMKRGASTTFIIPDGLFEYVDKETHRSFHRSEFESLLAQANAANKTLNYIYLGYSNLPVAHSAASGLYGETHGQGRLSLTYSNLGHVKNNSTMVDTILSAINSSDYTNWICEYEVTPGLIPEKGKINVIYRPIDLYDPFPDADATGRQTGSNWCGSGDCSSKNNTVSQYILNNRNVTSEEVYNKTPMYTFIMTPSVVKEIRSYNKANGYDQYTGSLNNSSYDYVCKEGTGSVCISEYLSHIIDITNAKNEPGACVQDKYRNVNDSTSFEGCRYE